MCVNDNRKIVTKTKQYEDGNRSTVAHRLIQNPTFEIRKENVTDTRVS